MRARSCERSSRSVSQAWRRPAGGHRACPAASAPARTARSPAPPRSDRPAARSRSDAQPGHSPPSRHRRPARQNSFPRPRSRTIAPQPTQTAPGRSGGLLEGLTDGCPAQATRHLGTRQSDTAASARAPTHDRPGGKADTRDHVRHTLELDDAASVRPRSASTTAVAGVTERGLWRWSCSRRSSTAGISSASARTTAFRLIEQRDLDALRRRLVHQTAVCQSGVASAFAVRRRPDDSQAVLLVDRADVAHVRRARNVADRRLGRRGVSRSEVTLLRGRA